MIKLAISGCEGRMGQRIRCLALEDSRIEVSVLIERTGHPAVGEDRDGIIISDDIQQLAKCDVLIDFTSPESTMNNLDACVKNKVKIVIGTTGLDEDQMRKIRDAGQTVAVVYSSNMSVGVNILFKLVQETAAKTPQGYKVHISEAHHVHKKDAPSGTAKTLGQIVTNASSKEIENIDSIREGDIVGDHDVVFESTEDVISLRHHAKTRDIFVKGALLAAKFLEDKTNGLFNMQDVLDLC